MERPDRIERSRAQILDAAERLFREKGYADCTVGDIAARAGMSRKTVYNLFENKELVARRLIERIEAAPDDLYRARMNAGEAALDILKKILSDSAQWCVANPSLAQLALTPSQRPDLRPPSDRPSFQGLVRDVLAHGRGQGVIRRDEDVDLMALVVLGVYGQAMLSALAKPEPTVPDIGRLVELVVEGVGA